jgi:hypothetical protein
MLLSLLINSAPIIVAHNSPDYRVENVYANDLSVAFNDVDLCLRIKEAGFYNVWTPYAEMYHYESASRGYEDTPEKQARFSAPIIVAHNSPDYRVENVYANAQPLRLSRR